MRLSLSYSMSDATAAHVGQGNPSSPASRTLSARLLSIVDRLASRSLTGQGLRILVHQHFGYRLHLEWSDSSSRDASSRFMERRFESWNDAESFATEICSLGYEGLCTCMYLGHNWAPHAKAPKCYRAPFYSSQKYLLLPKSELKSLEDMAVHTLCSCNITSASPDCLKW